MDRKCNASAHWRGGVTIFRKHRELSSALDNYFWLFSGNERSRNTSLPPDSVRTTLALPTSDDGKSKRSLSSTSRLPRCYYLISLSKRAFAFRSGAKLRSFKILGRL